MEPEENETTTVDVEYEVTDPGEKPAGKGAPAGKPVGQATQTTTTDEGDDDETAGGTDEEAAAEVDVLGEDVPDWLKKWDDEETPFKVSKAELDALYASNPEAAKLVSNLRRLVSDKVQALTSRLKAVESDMGNVQKEKRQLRDEKVRLAKLFNDPEIAKLLKPPEGEAPDEYTPEGRRWHARKEFSEVASQVFGEFGKLATKLEQEVQTETVEQQRAQAKEEVRAFASEHTDFVTKLPQIKALQKEYGGPGKLSAINAYWLVQAKAQAEAAQRKVTRNALVKPENDTTRTLPPTPDLPADELWAWYDAHPGTRERDAKEFEQINGR